MNKFLILKLKTKICVFKKYMKKIQRYSIHVFTKLLLFFKMVVLNFMY